MESEATELTVDVAPIAELPSAELAVVVTVCGDLDLGAVGAFVEQIDTILAGSPGEVTIDLGGVTFLDSSGLGALLTLQARCQSAGALLRAVNASRQVRRVLDLTKLTELFHLD